MTKPPGGWVICVQVGVAVVIVCCLSVWQVSRALEKIELKEQQAEQWSQPPLENYPRFDEPPDFRRVAYEGRFDSRKSFIVTNRQHNGRPGYWVVGVFNSDAGRFLVNRGWVPILNRVNEDPQFEIPSERLTIMGVLWPQSGGRQTVDYPDDEWPIRTRSIAVQPMAAHVGAFTREVRLLPESQAVFVAASTATDFNAARHWGYAVQWLLIGGVIVAGYWFLVVKRHLQKGE